MGVLSLSIRASFSFWAVDLKSFEGFVGSDGDSFALDERSLGILLRGRGTGMDVVVVVVG